MDPYEHEREAARELDPEPRERPTADEVWEPRQAAPARPTTPEGWTLASPAPDDADRPF